MKVLTSVLRMLPSLFGLGRELVRLHGKRDARVSIELQRQRVKELRERRDRQLKRN